MLDTVSSLLHPNNKKRAIPFYILPWPNNQKVSLPLGPRYPLYLLEYGCILRLPLGLSWPPDSSLNGHAA